MSLTDLETSPDGERPGSSGVEGHIEQSSI